jgi:hypothetical protein
MGLGDDHQECTSKTAIEDRCRRWWLRRERRVWWPLPPSAAGGIVRSGCIEGQWPLVELKHRATSRRPRCCLLISLYRVMTCFASGFLGARGLLVPRPDKHTRPCRSLDQTRDSPSARQGHDNRTKVNRSTPKTSCDSISSARPPRAIRRQDCGSSQFMISERREA